MVQVNRSSLFAQPRRVRKPSYDKEKLTLVSIGFIALLYLLWTAFEYYGSRNASTPHRATSTLVTPQHPSNPFNIPTFSHRESECSLWLAPSAVDPEKLSVFAGRHVQPGQAAANDIIIAVMDHNKNEKEAWHKVLAPAYRVKSELLAEHRFHSDVLLPGIGPLLHCAPTPELANVRAVTGHVDTAGVKRPDVTAGSFSYDTDFGYQATKPVTPGQELMYACQKSKSDPPPGIPGRSIDWIEQHGVCLDRLETKSSTIPNAGRGAFSKYAIQPGQPVAAAPLVHLDRSQLEILQQSTAAESDFPYDLQRPIVYSDVTTGQQLLLNYAYGHKDSNLLWIPVGTPGFHAINHSPTPNAALRWGTPQLGGHEYMEKDWATILNAPFEPRLMLEVVALKEIQPGDEILIDYGQDWQHAWDEHMAQWETSKASLDDTYTSAADYKRGAVASSSDTMIRTLDEQISDPYPDNLQTVCFIAAQQLYKNDEWLPENDYCVRRCDLMERFWEHGHAFYTAKLYPSFNVVAPASCGTIRSEGLVMAKIPAFAVDVVDKPYTSDVHLPHAFRHEISLPDSMVPEGWKQDDYNDKGQALATALAPGELSHIRWADTGEVLCPNLYRLGLHKKFSETLLDYANKMNITKILRHVTVEGNTVQKLKGKLFDLDGNEWYLQRPGGKWHANIHWLSPNDAGSTESWAELLSAAGFDEILQGIGESLGMQGLVAFHGSFMANSVSTASYMHYDIRNSDAKQYNIIIPLILPTKTGPELGIRASNGTSSGKGLREGRYKYEHDVAVVLGDYGMHSTHPVDFRMNKEFRMSATIYVADFNEHNLDGIMAEFTQDKYPPKSKELLMSWAGTHWKKDDPSVKLPTPSKDHILVRDAEASSAAA